MEHPETKLYMLNRRNWCIDCILTTMCFRGPCVFLTGQKNVH